MSRYVDGFVLPIPKDKLEDYQCLAAKAGAIWIEHGALEYHECAGDDLEVEGMIGFGSLVKAEPGETVVFAWAVFESREHRDEVNAKIMQDPRIAGMCDETKKIFDCKRMAYGGFKSIVQL